MRRRPVCFVGFPRLSVGRALGAWAPSRWGRLWFASRGNRLDYPDGRAEAVAPARRKNR